MTFNKEGRMKLILFFLQKVPDQPTARIAGFAEKEMIFEILHDEEETGLCRALC